MTAPRGNDFDGYKPTFPANRRLPQMRGNLLEPWRLLHPSCSSAAIRKSTIARDWLLEVVSRFWRQFVALHLRLRFFFHFFLNAAISALTSAYVRFQRTRFNGLGNRSIIAFGWRSPFLTPLGVFAICAATIIVASAVIWLACFIVERSKVL
jgi:hypothetical protein